MKTNFIISATVAVVLGSAITGKAGATEFNYKVDRFADIEVLRYKVTDFEKLSLRQKTLVYYLTEAALYG